MRRTLLTLAVVALAACSRTFTSPNNAPVLKLVSVSGAPSGDGGAAGAIVPATEDKVAVIRGSIHLVVAPSNGAAISRVEFFTPGTQIARASPPDLTWDVDTTDLFPIGGLMTVTATPYGADGKPGPALQESFIVDNEPPVIQIVAPAAGTALTPGITRAAACVRDRTATNPVTVRINGELAQPAPDLGARCFATLVDAEPERSATLELVFQAEDDLGNVGTATEDASVSRALLDVVSQFSFLADDPTVPTKRIDLHPFVPVAGGLVVNSPGPSSEYVATWIELDGGVLYAPLASATLFDVVGVPGSDGFAVALADTDGGADPLTGEPPVSPNLTELHSGAQEAAVLWLPIGAGASAPFHFFDFSPSGLCVVPSQLDASTVLTCVLPTGATVSQALSYPSGTHAVQSLVVSGDYVFVWHLDTNASQVQYQLDRFRLPSLDPAPLASQFEVDGCYAQGSLGAVCGGSLMGAPVRVDAADGSVTPMPNLPACDETSSPASRCVAVTGGGVVTVEVDAAHLRSKIMEYPADGGAPVQWGCIPDVLLKDVEDRLESLRADVSRDGRLYVAYATPANIQLEVLAFTAPGQLSWSWSRRMAGATSGDFHFALDDSSPDAPLWVTFDEAGEAVALSRHDPAVPPGGDGCP